MGLTLFPRRGAKEQSSAASLASYTWAGRPSAALAGAGARILITGLGPVPFVATSDGTYWIPASGSVLGENIPLITGLAQIAEQTLAQFVLPAGILARRPFKLEYSYGKNNATNNATHLIRIGTAGTTADLNIKAAAVSAGNLGAGSEFVFFLSSSTQIEMAGISVGTTNTNSLAGGAVSTALQTNGGALASSADSNAVYVSLNATMTGTSTSPTLGYCALRIM
jgi:hypothetical protein